MELRCPSLGLLQARLTGKVYSHSRSIDFCRQVFKGEWPVWYYNHLIASLNHFSCCQEWGYLRTSKEVAQDFKVKIDNVEDKVDIFKYIHTTATWHYRIFYFLGHGEVERIQRRSTKKKSEEIKKSIQAEKRITELDIKNEWFPYYITILKVFVSSEIGQVSIAIWLVIQGNFLW